MRIALLLILFALPAIADAKSETARIEINQGKRNVLTMVGPESAGQFTIWSGPGTGVIMPDGSKHMSTTPKDYADWLGGVVEPPKKLTIYQVRFYCQTPDWRAGELGPSHYCYGVRYGVDRKTGQGYIQIPALNDKEFPRDRPIAHEVPGGSWFRSTSRWEEVVRPQLDAALASAVNDTYNYYEQPYYRPPSSSTTAVGAKPTLTPKPK